MTTTETVTPDPDTTTPTMVVPPAMPPTEQELLTTHFAECLTGLHRINGHFVYMNTTVGVDGTLTIDTTRRNFEGDDPAIRFTYTPKPPEPTQPRPLPTEIDAPAVIAALGSTQATA